MKRMWERSRFWVPTAILFVALLTALSTPYLAGATASSSNRVPKTLWKTFPLDPNGGIARIEKRSSGAKESASPRKEKVAPTTSVAGDGTAHFAPPQSAGDDRLRLIAIALVAALALLVMILVTRSASRALRDIAGALPMDTIVLNASIILVSVLVGIGVVLLISPALGP
jgi:hypothetical protein